jgi:pimeloyl-ACP methyl ester carboxylesterase
VKALGGPAVLVGHSAAAAAAVQAAADAPDAVCGLVLVGPVVRDAMAPNAVMIALLRAIFLPFWGAWAWGRFYRTLFKAGTPADHDAHVAAIVRTLADPRRRRALLDVGMSTKAAYAARVGDVKAPVLAILGAKDPDYAPEAEAAWLREGLHADVRLLDGVGHEPHMEVPAATIDAMLGFFRGLGCRAA